MGELVDGVWQQTGIDRAIRNGALQRPPSIFRNWIREGEQSSFQPEVGRYHLYVSLACPWAHRTLIMRALKGLEDIISVSVVHYLMGDDGWTFEAAPGSVHDYVNGTDKLHELYTLADPHCTSRVTVPVLWDKKNRMIVSNESADIIKMFNSAFDHVGATEGDYYPERLRSQIDFINERVYKSFNNGVYRAGFATSQEVYNIAVNEVFDTMSWLEMRLNQHRFIAGDVLTEADIRLFTTLIRFDLVYHGHFKCNRAMLTDYHRLWDYTRYLYQMALVRQTVNFEHIKKHYYGSHPWINPSRIVPVGPLPDFEAPVHF